MRYAGPEASVGQPDTRIRMLPQAARSTSGQQQSIFGMLRATLHSSGPVAVLHIAIGCCLALAQPQAARCRDREGRICRRSGVVSSCTLVIKPAMLGG